MCVCVCVCARALAFVCIFRESIFLGAVFWVVMFRGVFFLGAKFPGGSFPGGIFQATGISILKHSLQCEATKRLCYHFNCKRLLIVSNLIWFNLKTRDFSSRWLWTSFLWNLFLLKTFAALFCYRGLSYFFTRLTS